jgi:hypothetical protein
LYASTKLRWIKQGKGINDLNPSLGFQKYYSRKTRITCNYYHYNRAFTKICKEKTLKLERALTSQVVMCEETLVS